MRNKKVKKLRKELGMKQEIRVDRKLENRS